VWSRPASSQSASAASARRRPRQLRDRVLDVHCEVPSDYQLQRMQNRAPTSRWPRQPTRRAVQAGWLAAAYCLAAAIDDDPAKQAEGGCAPQDASIWRSAAAYWAGERVVLGASEDGDDQAVSRGVVDDRQPLQHGQGRLATASWVRSLARRLAVSAPNLVAATEPAGDLVDVQGLLWPFVEKAFAARPWRTGVPGRLLASEVLSPLWQEFRPGRRKTPARCDDMPPLRPDSTSVVLLPTSPPLSTSTINHRIEKEIRNSCKPLRPCSPVLAATREIGTWPRGMFVGSPRVRSGCWLTRGRGPGRTGPGTSTGCWRPATWWGPPSPSGLAAGPPPPGRTIPLEWPESPCLCGPGADVHALRPRRRRQMPDGPGQLLRTGRSTCG
jgi:hypothetical protein